MNPDNTQRRVAFVIEALTVGGAEHMLVAMANRFAERGWSVHMICLTAAGELAERLDAAVQLSVLHKLPGFDWRLALRLRRLLRDVDPIAINSHLWTANLWSRVALPFTDRRIVVTEHSRDAWKPPHYRVIDRILARWTHKLVAVSHDTQAFYVDDIGINQDLTCVINNGIDTARFARGDGTALRAEWAEHGELLIGTVGRLVPAKNHIRLVEMTALLDKTLD
ncbi:MAG: glycosyltransferase, partial [Pseudomonadota bacterium]